MDVLLVLAGFLICIVVLGFVTTALIVVLLHFGDRLALWLEGI